MPFAGTTSARYNANNQQLFDALSTTEPSLWMHLNRQPLASGDQVQAKDGNQVAWHSSWHASASAGASSGANSVRTDSIDATSTSTFESNSNDAEQGQAQDQVAAVAEGGSGLAEVLAGSTSSRGGLVGKN